MDGEPVVDNRFPSLAALRADHAALLQEHRASAAAAESADAAESATPQGETESADAAESSTDQRSSADALLMERISDFIHRGQATGVLLDHEEDRLAVQSLLDYWAAILYRAGAPAPDATLEEFDPTLAPDLPDELCPYVGLYAFHEDDQNAFFGRQEMIDRALTHLVDERLLSVVGPSGSGKSSLVLAGIVPQLKAGGAPGSADWRYLPRTVPGSDPLRALARLFTENTGADAGAEPDTVALEQLQTNDQTLLEWLNRSGEGPALLVIDQFEEIFTLCNEPAQRRAFADNLRALLVAPGTEHRVILTMRTDFEPQVSLLGRFHALFEESILRVTPLSAAQLRSAIVKPADLVGLKFEEGLVDALVQDILGEPAALPLLQFTLQQLWEERERNRITWDAYRRLGGGRMALANTADALYKALIPEEQLTLRRILLRLVRPSEGLEITSSRMRVATLYQGGEARDRMERVLRRLIGTRLLRISGTGIDDSDSTGNGTSIDNLATIPPEAQVEIAHEALVRNWPRLVSWLEDERAAIRQRVRLTEAAQQWAARGRDPAALLRGVLLEEALRRDDLNELENAFVQASVDARDAEERAIEAARQYELEQAQALAESQRQSARRWRNLVIVLCVALAWLAYSSITIWRQEGRINVAETGATEAVATSTAAVATSTAALATATAAATSQAQATAASTAVAVATSVNYLEQGIALWERGDYDGAMALFSQAIERAPENANAYLERGNAFYRLGEYADALADFDTALALNPESITGYYRRGLAHAAEADYDAAIADFNEAIARNPEEAAYYFQRGKAHAALGNLDDALSDFGTALEKAQAQDAVRAEYYIERARALAQRTEYNPAIADLGRALELQPNNPQIYQLLGQIRLALGNATAAIAQFDTAVELAAAQPDGPPATVAAIRANRGDARAAAAQYPQAIADYTAAIDAGVEPLAPLYAKRAAAHARVENWPQSVDDWTWAIERYEENRAQTEDAAPASAQAVSDAELAAAYMDRGDVHAQQGDENAAIADYERAVILQPDNLSVYRRRAALFGRLGRYETALADLNRVLSTRTGEDALYVDRARLYMGMGAYPEAIRDYERVTVDTPDNAELRAELALALYYDGQFERVIDLYTELLPRLPQRMDLYLNRGSARYALGDFEGAIRDYSLALQRAPEKDRASRAAAYDHRGTARYALGQYAAAIDDFTRAIALDPTRSNAYLYRGHAYYALSLENLGQVVQDFSRALELDPTLPVLIDPRR